MDRAASQRGPLVLRQTAYRLVAEWVGMLQKLVDEQYAWVSQRGEGGVSSSSAGSHLLGSTDGDPHASFVYTPMHPPSQHRQLNRETGIFSYLKEEDASLMTDHEQAQDYEQEQQCAKQGRAMTVAVRGFLGCAQLRSFVNPVTNQDQHSYCVRSKADIVLERLPENMKLAAEIAFDYLVALSRAQPEDVLTLVQPYSRDSDTVNSIALLNEEKLEVEDYLTSLLASLQVAVHSSQTIIVVDMAAGLMLQLAEMRLKERNIAMKARALSEKELLVLGEKASFYYRRALQLYLDMQAGFYSGRSDSAAAGGNSDNPKLTLRDLSPSLSSIGVDLRAVSSAASSLGSLSCEQGRHHEGFCFLTARWPWMLTTTGTVSEQR